MNEDFIDQFSYRKLPKELSCSMIDNFPHMRTMQS